VFSRFGHVLLIIALLGATGGHLAVLQSIAWATMLADNSRDYPLEEAISKTFDGKHPCALCLKIARERHAEKKSDVQVEVKKLEFVRQSEPLFVISPAHFVWLREMPAAWSSLTQTPPVPPPRSLAS
jgi:hypothetical protein